MPFFEWLRKNSEHSLKQAAQEEMARRYLDRPGPAARKDLAYLFWRRLYVPAYRRLPWKLRRAIILAMPGSHRQRWGRGPPSTLGDQSS